MPMGQAGLRKGHGAREQIANGQGKAAPQKCQTVL